MARATALFLLRDCAGRDMEETPEQQNRVRCRGVRGATTVAADTREEIHAATRELVESIVAEYGIRVEDIASVMFTTTPDLRSAFPATAVRLMGGEWEFVPLMGAVEMDSMEANAIPRCIRVLLHWNTVREQREIRPVYMRGTEKLRRTTTDD